jgi:hypothetical protein
MNARTRRRGCSSSSLKLALHIAEGFSAACLTPAAQMPQSVKKMMILSICGVKSPSLRAAQQLE